MTLCSPSMVIVTTGSGRSMGAMGSKPSGWAAPIAAEVVTDSALCPGCALAQAAAIAKTSEVLPA